MISQDHLTTAALAGYRIALANNLTGEEAVGAAWWVVRHHIKRLRAPSPFEAVALNTSVRRSYRSPIAEVLQIPVQATFGQHCNQWPRTKGSLAEAQEVKAKIIEWFAGQTG